MPNIVKFWYTWILSAGATFHFVSSFLDVDSQRLLNFFRKIKMRDDVIIHSVLFLALMASIGHTHSQEHEAPKTGGHTYPSTNYRSYYPAPKYGGGYMPQYDGYQPPSYGGGYATKYHFWSQRSQNHQW